MRRTERRVRGRSEIAGALPLSLLLAACGGDDGAAGVPPASEPPAMNGSPGGSGGAAPSLPGTGGVPSGETPNDLDLTGQGGAPAGGAGPDEPSMPTPPRGTGPLLVEDLGRGVVAVEVEGGVYVGWRMLGYEYDREQPERIAYALYRDGQRIAVVTDSTNYLDESGSPGAEYAVAPIIDGAEGERSPGVTPWEEQFVRVPLERPSAVHTPNDMSVGDVDGDGEYELFLLWQPDNARDNSQAGVTDPVFIDALKLDGTRLWRIDLGPNIRAGAHYTQFVVIDADGDGRAEMAVKTAPGTRAGTGEFLSAGPAANDDDSAIFRNADGYVLSGPEYLTVFEGATGRELSTVAFQPPRGNVQAWGDGYGNRVDRFLAAAAYLDDSGLPSFVMARGYYTRSTLTAWRFIDGELSELWRFDSNETPRDAQGRPFTGQGAHSLSVADVDDDFVQEIIYGAMTVDNDGRGLCSSNMNHGDALHVADFVPTRPGLEVFMPTETAERPHWTVRDARTCEIVVQSDQSGADVGRGVAADVLASNPGYELWASNGVSLRSAETGMPIPGAPQPSSVNFLVWWDADETRELEDGTAITKLGVQDPLLRCQMCSSNNGTKSTPGLVADLLGDWREEVIWRESNNTALRVYTTTDVTARRIYTLMHDPQYRAAIAWQNVGYNQPPHPSFHIGAGMVAPPVPPIRVPAP